MPRSLCTLSSAASAVGACSSAGARPSCPACSGGGASAARSAVAVVARRAASAVGSSASRSPLVARLAVASPSCGSAAKALSRRSSRLLGPGWSASPMRFPRQGCRRQVQCQGRWRRFLSVLWCWSPVLVASSSVAGPAVNQARQRPEVPSGTELRFCRLPWLVLRALACRPQKGGAVRRPELVCVVVLAAFGPGVELRFPGLRSSYALSCHNKTTPGESS